MRLNSITDAEGNVTNYQYDPAGRLSGVWAPNYEYVVFGYDAGGRLAEKWFSNGVNAQYAYNPDGSLARLINRAGFTPLPINCTTGSGGPASDNTVISCHDYEYDGFGMRKRHVEGIRTATGSGNYAVKDNRYTFDNLTRLLSVADGGDRDPGLHL